MGGCRIHRLLTGSGVVGVGDDLGQRLEIWVVAESVREKRLSRGKLISWASHIDHDVCRIKGRRRAEVDLLEIRLDKPPGHVAVVWYGHS